MENHPIPQDVTGFQFKLIGNMTVKQFAYLAAGVVLAWIILQLPVYFIIKFPISVLFSVLGVSLAFLPIEGRPLDAMISHFIKALFSPTQFVYQKTGGRLYFPSPGISMQKNQNNPPPPQGDKLKVYLQSIPSAPKGKLDSKEENLLLSLANLTANSSSPLLQPKKSTLDVPIAPRDYLKPIIDKVLQSKKEVEENRGETVEAIKKTLEAAKIQEQALQRQSIDSSDAHKQVLELESKLQEISSQKNELAQQLAILRRKLDKDKNVFSPGTAAPKIETKNVKSIPQGMSKNIGLPMAPTAPNIITGIIKDPRGNTLPNILVEVEDKDGNPVRAFKTNGLGRFLSATPLINGAYIIKFEDPKNQHKFDTIEITVKNNIIMPLEIVSIDAREELRKSLFGA